MKKTILFQAFFIMTVFVSLGQQINGVIYYQNSGGKIASGVRVSAFGCNDVYSQENGMFTLNCPEKKAGQKLRLIIGNTDGKNRNIEVVNTQQLDWLRIPEDSPDDLVEVIICYAGEKNRAAIVYYGILIEATNKKYEERFDRIETQLQQKNISSSITAGLIAQMNELRKERNDALDRVEDLASFIANINQDNASELVKSAIQKIEQEKDIDAALTILDNIKLEEAYELALKHKLKSEAEIQQVIEGYNLKVRLLTPKFKYKEAILCYKRIIDIHINNNFDKKELAALYTKAASILYNDGQYNIALNYHQKAVDIKNEVLDPNHPDLGISYWNMALIYKEMKSFQRAISFQEKCLAIFKEALPEDHSDRKRALSTRLDIYYAKASDAFLKKMYAIALQDFDTLNAHIDNSNIRINNSFILNLKGLCHYYLLDYEKAIVAYKKAFRISPPIKEKYLYNNIGLAYAKNKQFKKARTAFREYEKHFPNEGRPYRNWAMYYALKNEKKKALYYLKKAVALGYDDMEWLKTDTSINNLRNENAFKEILRKIRK